MTLLIAMCLLVLSGCTGYHHAKHCAKPIDGYQYCKHVITVTENVACTGSCEKK